MCFSAAASFAVAGIAGVTGIAALRVVRDRREILLASFPLLFAIQQGVEGVLWTSLGSPDSGATCGMTNAFILFAEVIWPITVPLALLLVEPDAKRKRFMAAAVPVAIGLAAYLLYKMWLSPYQASAFENHIRYDNELDYSYAIYPVYLAVTCGPFLMSSHTALRQLGAVLVMGFFVAGYFYWVTFISVWCFFAAGASILVYRHFMIERSRMPSGMEGALRRADDSMNP